MIPLLGYIDAEDVQSSSGGKEYHSKIKREVVSIH
jgi:hypothetical protein